MEGKLQKYAAATSFQMARHRLEELVHSPIPEVARDAHSALEAAYHWEDSSETTGITARLLIAEVEMLERR